MYSDEVRRLFPHSSLLLDGTFEDELGQTVGIDDVVAMRPKDRAYYLKYAGSDVSLNWGSRGVFAIQRGGKKVRKHVREVAAASSLAHPWMLQRSARSSERVRVVMRDHADEVEAVWPVKYSGYYGPEGLIGVSAMHRRHTKVHGQHDTVFSVAKGEQDMR